jgi:DNA-binding beta-propeller fold protein YncE
MKFFKILICILIVIIYFYPSNIFAVDQFPDAMRLQPIPSGVRPSTPGNINQNELNFQNNSLMLSQISQYGFDESKLGPNTSYIDATNHILFVADADNNRVLVFYLNDDNVLVDYVPDNVLGQPNFTTFDPGTTQSTFNGPNGIAYDADNNKLFVADTNNNRIMVFDVSTINNGEDAVYVLGQPNFTTSEPGTTQSTFNSPYSVDYDSARKILFISDVNNNRVLIFDVSFINNGEDAVYVLGQPNFTTFDPGTTQSTFNGPNGIAYDADNNKLFVADTNNNRIMVFSNISISNGQDAISILGPNENLTMSPSIIARMQSKPRDNASFSQEKNISFSTIFFWLIILFIIAILIAVLIFSAKKKKKFDK